MACNATGVIGFNAHGLLVSVLCPVGMLIGAGWCLFSVLVVAAVDSDENVKERAVRKAARQKKGDYAEPSEWADPPTRRPSVLRLAAGGLLAAAPWLIWTIESPRLVVAAAVISVVPAVFRLLEIVFVSLTRPATPVGVVGELATQTLLLRNAYRIWVHRGHRELLTQREAAVQERIASLRQSAEACTVRIAATRRSNADLDRPEDDAETAALATVRAGIEHAIEAATLDLEQARERCDEVDALVDHEILRGVRNAQSEENERVLNDGVPGDNAMFEDLESELSDRVQMLRMELIDTEARLDAALEVTAIGLPPGRLSARTSLPLATRG